MTIPISSKPTFPPFRILLLISLFVIFNDCLYAQNINNKGSVSGIIWEDLNVNGKRDSTETGFQGIQIELYKGFNLISKDTSDINGKYSFLNLSSGWYRVKLVSSSIPDEYTLSPYSNYFYPDNENFNEDLDSDFEPITGISVSIYVGNLNSDVIDIKIDAGIYSHVGKISGNIWNDTNENEINDGLDSPEGGVRVYLINNNDDKVLDSTITNNIGDFEFDRISGGNYKIKCIAPAMKYFKSGSYLNREFQSQFIYFDKTVNSGPFLMNFDLGLIYKPDTTGSISGIVWDDINKNGIRDNGEAPVRGVKLGLLNISNNTIQGRVLTDNNGIYRFTGLKSGTYQAWIDLPKEYILSISDNTADDKDSDFNQVQITSPQIVINTSNGGIELNISSIDAGISKSTSFGSIGGRIWYDLNNDGNIDPIENKAPNVKVYLANLRYDYIDTVLTDINGNYLFENVPDGIYSVFLNIPFGYNISKFSVPYGTIDSDFDPYNLFFGRAKSVYSINTTLGIGNPGRDLRNVDAGFNSETKRASIKGKIWNDLSSNWSFDGKDIPLSGVQVLLSYNSEYITFNKTAISDSVGNYTFDNLPPGYYYLKYVLNGDFYSVKNDTLNYGPVNLIENGSGVLADVNKSNPMREIFGKISGNAWKEKSNSGIKSIYTNIPSLKVYLKDLNQNILDSTITNGSGDYTFDSLKSGKYYIKFDIPPGYNPTLEYVDNYGYNSDIDSNGETFFYEIDNSRPLFDPLREHRFVDAGLVSSGQIRSFVWEDSNLNGIQDNNESGLAEIEVRLMNASGLQNSILSDSTGIVYFDFLEPGTYWIEFAHSLPYIATISDRGNDDLKDSDQDVNTWITPEFTIQPDGPDNKNLTIGAGFLSTAKKGSVGDYVWLDFDKNGIQNNDEPGVRNLIIDLFKNGLIYSTDTSDVNGFFSFYNLDSANYYIKIRESSIPVTLKISDSQNIGADNNIDSDINPISMQSNVFTIDFNSIESKIIRSIDIALISNGLIGCGEKFCPPIQTRKNRK